MRHDETWKLKTDPRQDTHVVETEPRPRHEKACLETVSRQATCLKSQDSVTGVNGIEVTA